MKQEKETKHNTAKVGSGSTPPPPAYQKKKKKTTEQTERRLMTAPRCTMHYAPCTMTLSKPIYPAERTHHFLQPCSKRPQKRKVPRNTPPQRVSGCVKMEGWTGGWKIPQLKTLAKKEFLLLSARPTGRGRSSTCHDGDRLSIGLYCTDDQSIDRMKASKCWISLHHFLQLAEGRGADLRR